jgi:hypothetical protein
MIKRSLLALAVLIGAVALLAPSTAVGARVLPKSARPGGLSYNQWAALWGTAAWSRSPEAPTALLTARNGKCGLLHVRMWFLPDTIVPGNLTTRCVLSHGGPIFVPIASIGGPATRKNIAERPLLRGLIATAQIIVDGRSLGPGRWVSTPVYRADVPLHNPFGLPPITHSLITDGYVAILAPLAPGNHTIVTRASFADAPDVFGGYTYHLTIK